MRCKACQELVVRRPWTPVFTCANVFCRLRDKIITNPKPPTSNPKPPTFTGSLDEELTNQDFLDAEESR